MSKEWWDNFRGRCVACDNAIPSTRKDEMTCQYMKAWNRGLPSRPSGMIAGVSVHKLYGCVYYTSKNMEGME